MSSIFFLIVFLNLIFSSILFCLSKYLTFTIKNLHLTLPIHFCFLILLFSLLLHLFFFICCSLIISSFSIPFSIVFKFVSSSLIFLIMISLNFGLLYSMYFNYSSSISSVFILPSSFNCLKNSLKSEISNTFKAVTKFFDLVPKSLYSFVSTSKKVIFIASMST